MAPNACGHRPDSTVRVSRVRRMRLVGATRAKYLKAPPPSPRLGRIICWKPSSMYPAGMIPLSVLDLSPIVQGGTPALAFRRTLELAQHAERLGYTPFWLGVPP